MSVLIFMDAIDAVRTAVVVGACALGLEAPVVAAQEQPERRDGTTEAEATTRRQLERYIRLTQSHDSDDRLTGAKGLTRMGPAAAPALQFLWPLLQNQPDDVCLAAYRAVCAIGPAGTKALPRIVKTARRGLSTEGRCATAYQSCSYWPEAIPYLVRELGRQPATDEVPEGMLTGVKMDLVPLVISAVVPVLREGGRRAESAAGVLWRLREAARPALPALVKAVRTRRITDGTFAWAALQIGASDPDAIAELERIAREHSDLTGQQAREALARVGR